MWFEIRLGLRHIILITMRLSEHDYSREDFQNCSQMKKSGETVAVPSRSDRMRSVQMPVMGFVADLMRENPGTISVGQGVVHYGPPARAIKAAQQAVTAPNTHGYGYVIGRSSLRSAFAEKLNAENRLDPGYEVVVTAGSNMAFFASLLAITSPGDEVILLVPYYFNHEMATYIAGCKPVLVSFGDSLIPDVETIERAITPKPVQSSRSPLTIRRALYMLQSTLRAINDLCAAHGIYHMSDEAYEYFTFDGCGALLSREFSWSACTHDLAFFYEQGIRNGGLAFGVYGGSATGAGRHSQDSGYESDLSGNDKSVNGTGSTRGGSRLLQAVCGFNGQGSGHGTGASERGEGPRLLFLLQRVLSISCCQ